MTLSDKLLLRKLAIIETVNDKLKNKDITFHRSTNNDLRFNTQEF